MSAPPNLNPYLGVPLAEADGAPFVDELFAALDGHTAVHTANIVMALYSYGPV